MATQRKSIRLAPSVYCDPGRVFSVTIGTNPRRPVFEDLELGQDCIGALRQLREETHARIYAFCLMPDHVHLLIGVTERSPLPTLVGAWKSRCYQMSRRRGKPRSFWQRSYFDHALRSDENLRKVAEYILNNPVRAGIVQRFEDYPLCGSLEFDLGP